MKYTAIWVDSWMTGSHRHSLTKITRFTVKEGQTLKEVLIKLDLENRIVFLFKGWPLLQGEDFPEHFIEDDE